jgi:hypothetical protein
MAVVGGEDRAEQDARVRTDADIAAQDGVRRDVGAGVDRRLFASMRYKHSTT